MCDSEVFCDIGNVYLPGSKIKSFGCVCRELEQENFELNGYAPDISVPDGKDAMDVAMNEIQKSKILSVYQAQQQGLEK